MSADVLRGLLDRPGPRLGPVLGYNDKKIGDDFKIAENFSERPFKTVIYYS